MICSQCTSCGCDLFACTQLILEHPCENSHYVHVGPIDASRVSSIHLPRETAAVATMITTCYEKVKAKLKTFPLLTVYAPQLISIPNQFCYSQCVCVCVCVWVGGCVWVCVCTCACACACRSVLYMFEFIVVCECVCVCVCFYIIIFM